MVDFLFVMNFFRYLLRLRRYKRKSIEVGIFRRGGSLWAQISDGRWRRLSTTVGARKLVIAVSCIIKMFAVYCLVLSQSTRVTDRQTDRQNYDFPCKTALANIAASRGIEDRTGHDSQKVTKTLCFTYLGRGPHWTDLHRNFHSDCCPQHNHIREVSNWNFRGLRFYRG